METKWDGGLAVTALLLEQDEVRNVASQPSACSSSHRRAATKVQRECNGERRFFSRTASISANPVTIITMARRPDRPVPDWVPFDRIPRLDAGSRWPRSDRAHGFNCSVEDIQGDSVTHRHPEATEAACRRRSGRYLQRNGPVPRPLEIPRPEKLENLVTLDRGPG